jgi:hypothetical protein
MARARSKAKSNWWELEILEWIAVLLAFLGIVAVFCVFFIRRHVIEYHLDHTFGVDDPEFFGSHRRVLVVDGKVGFTGGVGFAEQWCGHAQDPKPRHASRDRW